MLLIPICSSVDPNSPDPPSSSGKGLASDFVCSSVSEMFEVGGFYEIDHEQLLPKSPIHLKDVRVVKVCT